jgi:hypothetical protein
MFSGERVVTEEAKLKRDTGFLIKSNVSPIPVRSIALPLITYRDRTIHVADFASDVVCRISDRFDLSQAHHLYDATRRNWHPSDNEDTRAKIADICQSIAGHVLRVGSPQEYLFAFHLFIHAPLWKTAKNKEHLLADIAYGIGTNLGDGGRYDDHGGKTSFDQLKGTRARSVHLYIRNFT